MLHKIELHGQGDIEIYLVTEEVYNWAMNEGTPGRVGDEGSWADTDTPEILRAARRKRDDNELVYVTSGSYINDRALLVGPAAVHSFSDVEEYVDWCCESVDGVMNRTLVSDDSFGGYIY